MEDVDIREAVDSVIQLVHSRAEEASVGLSCVVPPGLPPLRADRQRIKQIMFNMLSNAIKFTPPGGETAVIAKLDTDAILITVADNGIGMTDEEMEVALTPFGQADGTISRKFEGTGLGLPLSKSFVEMHQGSLWIESEKGVGTRVHIRLPHADRGY